MLEWWYQAQLWFGVIAGLLLVVMGLIGRKPSPNYISLAVVSSIARCVFGLVDAREWFSMTMASFAH